MLARKSWFAGRMPIYLASAGLLLLVATLFNSQLLNLLRATGTFLVDIHTSQPAISAIAYVAVYVILASLPLPFAAVLTIMAGPIFGPLLGTALVSFGAAMAAVLTFLWARYVASISARDGYGSHRLLDSWKTSKHPAFLILLRLFPGFPFFFLNAALGLTSVRLWTYIWTSAVGMLPGTLLYVYGGAGIASILASKEIAASLVGLAITLFAVSIAVAAGAWARMRRRNGPGSVR